MGPAVTAAKANAPPAFLKAEIVVTVDEITFVDPAHAAVWFSIFVNDNPMLSGHRGDAVLVESEWMMACLTFCQIMAMAGSDLSAGVIGSVSSNLEGTAAFQCVRSSELGRRQHESSTA